MLLRKVVRLMFGPRTLFYTNVLSSGGLLGFSDWVVQKVFEKTDKNRQEIDWARTVGLFFGPVSHFWYKYLDRFLPLANASTVAKKVVIDQACAGPVFLAYFFAANGMLEGKPANETWKEFRQKFLSIYTVECMFWPTAQAFNFYFLPSYLRVVYMCVMAGIYDAFLSFMKYEPSSEAYLFLKPED